MILLLDNYILELIKSTKNISDTIKYASDKLITHYFKESLIEIQKELNIT